MVEFNDANTMPLRGRCASEPQTPLPSCCTAPVTPPSQGAAASLDAVPHPDSLTLLCLCACLFAFIAQSVLSFCQRKILCLTSVNSDQRTSPERTKHDQLQLALLSLPTGLVFTMNLDDIPFFSEECSVERNPSEP